MISIELDIFSGNENPRWSLTAAEITDFVASLVADLSVVRPLLSIPSTLGFRGYVVRLTGLEANLLGLLGVPAEFRITPLPLDLSYLDVPLAPSAPGDVEDAVDAANEELPDESDLPGGGGESVALAQALAACSLNYTSWNDFSFWNGSRVTTNNCYCYAANYASNYRYSVPGRHGGNALPPVSSYATRPSATRFTTCMQADGWKTTCNGSSLRIVGLLGKVVYPDGYAAWDMHFYRKNLNGSGATRWCHKPGGTPVTNKDYSGSYITSVSTADRSTSGGGYTYNYNQIIGTFYSPAGTRSVTVA